MLPAVNDETQEGQRSVLTVPDSTRPVRIDSYLTEHGIAPSRSQSQRLIEAELVTVDGKPVRTSYKVKGGDTIIATIPTPSAIEICAEDIPLPIVYEDDHLAIVNKPAGMVTHPAPGNWTGTLVNALLHHLKGLSGIGGRERPGIVHRLDKDTSGLMVVAKSDLGHKGLSAQFKAHNMDRRYRALVAGVPKPAHGTVSLAIGRDRNDRKRFSRHTDTPRDAVTHYRTMQTFGQQAALLELKLETGRTHQIRVHLTHIGHPVLGDPTYGGKQAHPSGLAIPRQMLHAARLAFIHPETAEEVTFDAPPPDDFLKVLAALEKKSK